MKPRRILARLAACLGLWAAAAGPALAQPAAPEVPAVQQHTWVAKNFRFHTGEVLPEVTLAYATLYQWNASRDFNPDLSTVRTPILAINSADDERNPPELKAVEAARKTVPQLREVLIPASADTSGHNECPIHAQNRTPCPSPCRLFG